MLVLGFECPVNRIRSSQNGLNVSTYPPFDSGIKDGDYQPSSEKDSSILSFEEEVRQAVRDIATLSFEEVLQAVGNTCSLSKEGGQAVRDSSSLSEEVRPAVRNSASLSEDLRQAERNSSSLSKNWSSGTEQRQSVRGQLRSVRL